MKENHLTNFCMNLFITKNYVSMKRILKITAVAFAIVLGSALQNKASAQYSPDADVSYQNFYDELSPYGDWIEYPGYGYVWQPQMGDDFRPYSSGGQWVWNDDYEWMWVSDYDWGWAPFHYGRWFEDDNYGWLWQPGYEWSPAWVAWRDGGDNYGWAPLRPGINITVGFNIGGYNPPISYWNFAPRRYINSRNIYSYCLPWHQNTVYINQTVIINNFNYSNSYGFRTGPRRYEAERYCGTIRSVSFRQSYSPGRTQFRNNEVSVYRPNIRRDDNRNFTPRQFNRYDRQSTGNRGQRNDNGNVRGNNLPDRQQRNNNDVRQPQNNNNGSADRRRFDRNDNNSQQPNRNNDIRAPRQIERPNGNTNNPNGSTDRRRLDRNDNNSQQPNRNNDVRAPRQIERPDMNQGNNNRQLERRNSNNGNTNTDARQPGNEMRRNDNRTQPQRQSSPQPEQRRVQQEQPRQPERRSDGNNRQQNSNDDNKSNRNGRRF
jgi:hypothetical protein